MDARRMNRGRFSHAHKGSSKCSSRRRKTLPYNTYIYIYIFYPFTRLFPNIEVRKKQPDHKEIHRNELSFNACQRERETGKKERTKMKTVAFGAKNKHRTKRR